MNDVVRLLAIATRHQTDLLDQEDAEEVDRQDAAYLRYDEQVVEATESGEQYLDRLQDEAASELQSLRSGSHASSAPATEVTRRTAEIIAAQLRAEEARAQAAPAQRVVEETHQAAQEAEKKIGSILDGGPDLCISFRPSNG